jgi:Flp pilus assembly protein TadG
MARRPAWSIRDDRGSLAVEFGLTAPLFLLLILALADFGTAALELSTMRSAARAGLQAVLSNADDTAGASFLAETAAPSADVAVTTVCVCPDGTEIECGDTCAVGAVRRVVTVAVTRDLPLLVPWPGMPDPLPLAGLARARVR